MLRANPQSTVTDSNANVPSPSPPPPSRPLYVPSLTAGKVASTLAVQWCGRHYGCSLRMTRLGNYCHLGTYTNIDTRRCTVCPAADCHSNIEHMSNNVSINSHSKCITTHILRNMFANHSESSRHFTSHPGNELPTCLALMDHFWKPKTKRVSPNLIHKLYQEASRSGQDYSKRKN